MTGGGKPPETVESGAHFGIPCLHNAVMRGRVRLSVQNAPIPAHYTELYCITQNLQNQSHFRTIFISFTLLFLDKMKGRGIPALFLWRNLPRHVRVWKAVRQKKPAARFVKACKMPPCRRNAIYQESHVFHRKACCVKPYVSACAQTSSSRSFTAIAGVRSLSGRRPAAKKAPRYGLRTNKPWKNIRLSIISYVSSLHMRQNAP